MNALTRGAVFGAACALCAVVAAGTAAAQNFPPGTNCQSLLPALRPSCLVQARQMNSGAGINSNTTVIPNSTGANTVTTPGSNSLNSGTMTVVPNGVTPSTGGVAPTGVSPNGVAPTGVGSNGTVVTPNGTTVPSGTSTNGVLAPNAVNPNGTISPNATVPSGTVPNPLNQAPATTPIIIPPNNSGVGAGGAPGGIGTGVGAGGTGAGTGTGTGAGGTGTSGN